MATFTQDKQPYGREDSMTRTVDGIKYRVCRLGPGYLPNTKLVKWELRRFVNPADPCSATVQDAFVFLPPDATVRDAVKRLLG